jgi:hypothetical protein
VVAEGATFEAEFQTVASGKGISITAKAAAVSTAWLMRLKH